jgi:hypothetical protein
MQFEIFCRELAHGAAMIQSLVAGVTPEQARVKPSPEAWSVLEVLGHLCEEERGDFRQHLARILQTPAPPSNPPTGTDAPPYSEHDPAQVLDEFLAERQRSLVWLRQLPAPDWTAAITIPFGPFGDTMRVQAGDMLTAWAAHDNLHARQLVELWRARLLDLAKPFGVEYAGGW